MKEESKIVVQKPLLQQALVSGSVEYIQLISTGTKAYWDDTRKHFISINGRFHISLDAAIKRSDMYIHYR